MCDEPGNQAYVAMEGYIQTPEEALKCLELGAHFVVVGSAITRHLIAHKYVETMKSV